MGRLLACRTVQEALAWLDDIEIGSASNYLLGDASGDIVDVELGSRKMGTAAGDRLWHTNHYLTGEMRCLDNGARSLPNSHYRLERVSSLFGDGGSYEEALAVLQDHEGHPTSVCRHGTDMVTAASIVIDLGRRSMLVCKGNPCVGKYEAYEIA
jgi:isopenicillin-N N-acyltransferase like protein